MEDSSSQLDSKICNAGCISYWRKELNVFLFCTKSEIILIFVIALLLLYIKYDFMELSGRTEVESKVIQNMVVFCCIAESTAEPCFKAGLHSCTKPAFLTLPLQNGHLQDEAGQVYSWSYSQGS